MDAALIWDWATFAMRWLHVVTAIAWIGSSFYFIALDLGLRSAPDLPKGAAGEEWQVHGGGFYHIRKYLVAPARMPEHLTWFKWESYATWLSGAALLILVYWHRADLFLIDPAKIAWAPWQGMALSAASLGLGWLIYDAACKSPLGNYPVAFMAALLVALTGMAWGYGQIFTDRAAFLHLGAYTATIMTANVFLIIIPNQKIVVAELMAGRAPDPKYGKIAKLRSMHNNYLTLPVVFFMLSNHAPLAFATSWAWVIAALVFLMGVTIRHWFNSRHARKPAPYWTIPATLLLFGLCVWLSTLGPKDTPEAEAALSGTALQFAQAPGFDEVASLVTANCAMCHTREPAYEGMLAAPKGLLLDTPEAVARAAEPVFIFAGLTTAMPPGAANVMTPEDRAAIRAWYRAGAEAELARN